MPDYSVEHTADHVKISFGDFYRYLTSAPLGAGMGFASNFVNMRVKENFKGDYRDFPAPEKTIAEYCKSLGIAKCTVGMMTAADMGTFTIKRQKSCGVWIDAAVTSGLTNARRVGESADWPYLDNGSWQVGTINIAVMTNAFFSEGALVEAVSMTAEAKAALLLELGINSRKGGETATGTGTDAIAVFSALNGREIVYCGKHVLAGEMLGNAVMDALRESLLKYNELFGRIT